MFGISYWVVPLFSAAVWLAMLLAMLLTWVTQGEPVYPSMQSGQTIAYISDVGAEGLKPLFIAMSAVTVVSFDLVLIFERWLRHTGRLTHNTSMFQKGLALLSIIFAIAGAAGLILLSIFDTLRHPHLHDGFLVLFMGGYILSAIFTCWEYQRLGIHYRQHRILHASFWVKLVFILVEIALAIVFGVLRKQNKYNDAAIVEWVIAFVFTFYVLSYFIDFIPATHGKHQTSRETALEMAEGGSDSHLAQPPSAGRYYGNAYGAQHDGPTVGYMNGGAGPKPNLPPSSNF